MSQQSKKKYVIFGKGTMPTGRSALQITCIYNNAAESGVAVVVDDKTLTTNFTGVVTFTDLSSGEKTVVASKNGFNTDTSTQYIDTSFETKEIILQPTTITFTCTDEENNPVAGVTVTFGTDSQTTDVNGQASFSGILDGNYNYTITSVLYDDIEGTVVVARSSQNKPIVLISSVITCYAIEAVEANANIKANRGVGDSDADYDIYAEDTATTNELTLDGLAVTSAESGQPVEAVVNENDAEISVIANEDDAEIAFNNDNTLNQVTINVVAKDIYIAFTQSDKTMYFKNDTRPFVASENTFESKSYTYYTYENNAMVSHSATTSSVTVGTNSYDGTTLKIDTTDTFSNGTWTKDSTKNIEIDDGNATITTSGYLTTPQPIIPRSTYFRFALGKLNPNQWETKLLIGGQEKKFINYQEFTVQANQLIEIYQTKKGSTNLVDSYGQYFYISNDRIFKKLKYIVTSNVAGSTFKFTVNGTEFTYEGSSANIEVYEGQTISWSVSAEGYTTQTGTYTVANYPTIDSYTNTVTLVQA